MGVIDQWRKMHRAKRESAPEKSTPPPVGAVYFDSLSTCIGAARLRQLAFGRLVGERSWNVDFARGTIRFGEDEYPVQFLGTESMVNDTWLWAFVNPGGYPAQVLAEAQRFYAFCMDAGMEELRDPELPLTPLVNGHNLASLAAGVFEEDMCYYRCPYQQGAAFVLVKDLPEEVFRPAAVKEVVDIITDLIRQVPLNHRALAQGLLKANCASFTEGEAELRGAFADGASLTILFDEQGRIHSLRPTAPGQG